MNYKGYTGINPRNETLYKWLFTRKRSKFEYLTFGDFQFPGFFTTQHYNSDRLFFWIAILCEIGFLVTVSIMVGGFDLYLSLAALICVALDLIGAFYIHKNEDEVNFAHLRYEIAKYKMTIAQVTSNELKEKKDNLINVYRTPYRYLGKGLIIVSALLKILGSAVLFELPVFTIVLTVIYCFVAWIHIKKTGFYWSARRFFNAMNDELERHLSEGGNDNLKNKTKEDDFGKTIIENIPDKVELKPIRMGVFPNLEIYDGIIYDEVSKQWKYRIWNHHKLDDEDLQAFITSSDVAGNVLSDSAKAFIASDFASRFFINIKDDKK